MHFSHFITAALTVATGANAYAVDAFSGPNCSGNKQYVNIWDNTCGTWMNGFQSIRVVYFGSGNQNAHICRATSCHECKKWNAVCTPPCLAGHELMNELSGRMCFF
jgi:hypothetical protein